MKISMEFDMTPRELRELFGLPDVQPMHQEVMERIREKILKGVDDYDPASFLTAYSAEGARTLQGLQEAFWNSFGGAKTSKKDD